MALIFQYGSNCSESEITGQERLRGNSGQICKSASNVDH
jgi:hypothetical protein